jgi:hypothetical protein
MRHVFLSALMAVCFAGDAPADEPKPDYFLTQTPIRKMGDKVAGDIFFCIVSQGDKAKMCFGLTKEFDAEPRFTFVALFRSGNKQCKQTGGQGRGQRSGTVTKNKYFVELGEYELPLEYETQPGPTSGKFTYLKFVVGDVEIPDKGPRVVLVDLLAEKPAYKLVKVDLPACGIDLADKEHKTWLKPIDEAIAELKKNSSEISELAD